MGGGKKTITVQQGGVRSKSEPQELRRRGGHFCGVKSKSGLIKKGLCGLVPLTVVTVDIG